MEIFREKIKVAGELQVYLDNHKLFYEIINRLFTYFVCDKLLFFFALKDNTWLYVSSKVRRGYIFYTSENRACCSQIDITNL